MAIPLSALLGDTSHSFYFTTLFLPETAGDKGPKSQTEIYRFEEG
jgi:hypothetical protein